MSRFKPVMAKSAYNEDNFDKWFLPIWYCYILLSSCWIILASFGLIQRGIGVSMADTFGEDDLTFYGIIGQNYSPDRGDIVAFSPPGVTCSKDGTVYRFQKRIIGLPGETVSIQGYHVFINGVEISEPYAHWDPIPYPVGDPSLDIPCEYDDSMNQVALDHCVVGCDPEVLLSWDVPEGHVFVMGDGRYGCFDSRSFGFVPFENLYRQALMQFWPPSHIQFFGNQSY